MADDGGRSPALVVAPGRQWLDGVIFDITERRGLEEELRRSLAEGAAAQERLRLARDLHDAVGHALTVGAIQAGGARAVVGSDPAAAERALHEVENCLREALREMREMVSALHYDPDSPPDGYLRLDDLIASAGRASLDARLIVTGDERPLPAAVQASLYRSVQECLTNCAKYAPGAHVTIDVAYIAEGVALTVADDGTGCAEPAMVMQSSPEASRGILDTLDRHAVEYLILGGTAANAYGAERITKDFDCPPGRSPDNLAGWPAP